MLRHLWRWLPDHALAEYKSPRHPFAAGGLARLLGHGCPYHVAGLTLPDGVLRGLSDDYVAGLPPDVRDAVRTRRGR